MFVLGEYTIWVTLHGIWILVSQDNIKLGITYYKEILLRLQIMRLRWAR